MAININGAEHLCGPASHLGKFPNSWCDTGQRYPLGGLNRELYVDDRGHYWLVWVPVNSQWPVYCACRTLAQLIKGWS